MIWVLEIQTQCCLYRYSSLIYALLWVLLIDEDLNIKSLSQTRDQGALSSHLWTNERTNFSWIIWENSVTTVITQTEVTSCWQLKSVS